MIRILLVLSLLFSLGAQAQDLKSEIPYPFYVVQDKSENLLTIVDHGLAALQLRIDMIRRAQKSIEVEYFIYKTDRAGKLITLALIDAVKRGVKVRILMDKTVFITELDKYFAYEFKKLGIEMKYYNAIGAEYILATQFRNHRKLLVIDDYEALTGGRNIGEDYFNMSEHMNYTDRDVHVRGPMAKVMRESFDKYYESPIATYPKEVVAPDPSKTKKVASFQKKLKPAQEFMTEDSDIAWVRFNVETLARPQVSALQAKVCPETTYATDAPGFRSNGIIKPSTHAPYRFLRRVIFDRIQRTDKELYMASPYLINNKASLELMEDAIERGVKISIFTNSLSSTDAIYMSANMYSQVKKYAKKDVMVYLHNGLPYEDEVIYDEAAVKAKWGVHDKTMVFDSKDSNEVMIGSYNIDNRSYHFNTELAIFCKGNNEFSNELRTSMMERQSHGLLFTKDGKAIDKDGAVTSIYGSNKNKLLLMKFISLPARILRYFL